MFRERPLTWLFLIATLLLDGVLACGGESRNLGWTELPWAGFLFGQSMVLGAWLVIGQSHRLARGAVFVGGQVSIAFVFDVWRGQVPPLGLSEEAVTMLSMSSASAFCATLILRTVSLPLLATRSPLNRLQFPLIELFGWTIVVALASLLVRQVDYGPLVADPTTIVEFVGSSVVVAFLIVLFSPPAHPSVRSWIVVLAVEGVYFPLVYFAHDSLLQANPQGVFWVVAMHGVGHLYAALWLLMQRFDDSNHQPVLLNIDARHALDQSITPASTEY